MGGPSGLHETCNLFVSRAAFKRAGGFDDWSAAFDEPFGEDVVAPSVRSSDSRVHAAQQGGHVLEPLTGKHRNVWVFDFKSLYPSLIRTFNIDPLSYVADSDAGRDADRNARRRVPARACDPAADARRAVPPPDAAKQRGDDVAAHAIKILMNSMYGVLGTPACRFYNPALANSITGTGKEMLLWSKSGSKQLAFMCFMATRTACSSAPARTMPSRRERADRACAG